MGAFGGERNARGRCVRETNSRARATNPTLWTQRTRRGAGGHGVREFLCALGLDLCALVGSPAAPKWRALARIVSQCSGWSKPPAFTGRAGASRSEVLEIRRKLQHRPAQILDEGRVKHFHGMKR